MKKSLMSLAIVLLLGAGLFAEESTATLESGATVTLQNNLPESVREPFQVELLANRFPSDYPFDLWVMVGLQDQNHIILAAKVINYDPALDTGFKRLYIAESNRLSFSVLSIMGPDDFMGKLAVWFQTQTRELPRSLINTPYFQNAPNYLVAYEKGPNERMIFQGGHTGTDIHIIQPITIQIPGYQQAQVYASSLAGNRSRLLSDISAGRYPLDLPIDNVTEQKRTTWLIYDFLDMVE